MREAYFLHNRQHQTSIFQKFNFTLLSLNLIGKIFGPNRSQCDCHIKILQFVTEVEILEILKCMIKGFPTLKIFCFTFGNKLCTITVLYILVTSV